MLFALLAVDAVLKKVSKNFQRRVFEDSQTSNFEISENAPLQQSCTISAPVELKVGGFGKHSSHIKMSLNGEQYPASALIHFPDNSNTEEHNLTILYVFIL